VKALNPDDLVVASCSTFRAVGSKLFRR